MVDLKLKKLLFRTAVFILSLSFAWWLIKSGDLQSLVETVIPSRFVTEIIAGVFYTSFLTSPISVAMLVVLAKGENPILTALFAGLGAVLGDIIIIKLFRGGLSVDLSLLLRQLQFERINRFLQKLHLSFVIPLLGVLIIASPFPDELGLLMLGASKLKYREIVILTYILNTAGILLIVIPINLIS